MGRFFCLLQRFWILFLKLWNNKPVIALAANCGRCQDYDEKEGITMKHNEFSPFGWRDKVGYLLGDFGNDFTFIFSTVILMKFYTDVMGVPAFVVGNIMMVTRFVDAFTDIAMGRLADSSRTTRAGKYKPWLLRMCLPVAVSSFLMYQSALAGWPLGAKVVYLLVTYLLWSSFCYTGINIPYGSMASAISPRPDDRQSLSTYRTMGGMLAGAVIGVLLPMLAYGTDAAGNTVLVGARVTAVAGAFSLAAVLCYLLAYGLITERVRSQDPNRPQQQPLGQMLRNAVSNRALVSLIAASIVMLLAQLTMQNMAAYVFPNYYRLPRAQALSTLCMMVGMLLAAAGAKPLARRYGKAELSVWTNLLAGLVNLLLYVVRPDSVWVYIGFQTVAWLGLGVFSMVSWALVTDVIDDAEIRNGVREDGAVYALYSWARKLGQAAASGLTGLLLTAIGYTAETAFDPQVTRGIFSISVLVPAFGFVSLAAILWFWYPLRKKQVEQNVAYLNEKHGRG